MRVHWHLPSVVSRFLMLFVSAYMLSTGLKVMEHSRLFYSTGRVGEDRKKVALSFTTFACALPKLTTKVRKSCRESVATP